MRLPANSTSADKQCAVWCEQISFPSRPADLGEQASSLHISRISSSNCSLATTTHERSGAICATTPAMLAHARWFDLGRSASPSLPDRTPCTSTTKGTSTCERCAESIAGADTLSTTGRLAAGAAP